MESSTGTRRVRRIRWKHVQNNRRGGVSKLNKQQRDLYDIKGGSLEIGVIRES